MKFFASTIVFVAALLPTASGQDTNSIMQSIVDKTGEKSPEEEKSMSQAINEALQAMQPGTKEEQQSALDDLKVTWVSGPVECDEEDKIDAKKFVSVEYYGRISKNSASGEPGKLFDSSERRGHPLEFQHSLGQVPRGFDFATRELCVGVNATIEIPPLLAFGDEGNGGSIPPNATLEFSVLVKKVAKEDWRPEFNYFEHMDYNQDGLVSKEEMVDFMARHYSQGVPDKMWAAIDKDSDGYADWDEFPFGKGEEYVERVIVDEDERDKILAEEEEKAAAEEAASAEDLNDSKEEEESAPDEEIASEDETNDVPEIETATK